ncbi:S66 peptidase family protein [Deferrisoma palaeochoriense]
MNDAFPPLSPLRPLRTGDLVALVAAAGPVTAERAEGAKRLLEARGLRVRLRYDPRRSRRYLAAGDEERWADLWGALTDPEVAAVWFLRGGYGAVRLLPRFAAEDPPPAPKPLVGFSDNTALLAFVRRWGWPALHGPHPDPDDPDGVDAVLGSLGFWGEPARPAQSGLRLWNPGAWEPRVAAVEGGCLALLAALQGTPYAPAFSGKIAFLEDVGEPAYRLDRMLWQLVAAGAFEGCRGVVFGRPESFVAEDRERAAVEELLHEFASQAPFPVLSGVPAGHCRPNLPLPLGRRAYLDPEGGRIAWIESLVEP